MEEKRILECLYEVMKLELQNEVVCDGKSIVVTLADGSKKTIKIEKCK